jgi:hypothetical protein
LIETIFSLIENSRGWNALALALVSAILYALVSNVAWRLSHLPVSEIGAGWQRAATQPVLRPLYQIVRLLFYVGMPFAALYFGWIDLRAMGLGALDWADGVRWTIIILLAAWLFLMVIWLPYLRATSDVPPVSQAALSFPRRMVELIYMQAHWAFYRAAGIVFFTGVIRGELYWGALLGLALTCLEAFANPQVRSQLTRVGEADSVVWNAGQAVLNTFAFLVTRNLLFVVGIHFMLEVSVPHVRQPRAVQTPPTEPLPTPKPVSKQPPNEFRI